MKDNKLKTYLGFAIKSGKIIFGYDKLFEGKKRPILVIVCSSLNEKNTNKIAEYCTSLQIKMIKLNKYVLSDLISRENCKVLGICDTNFSNVICNELDELNGKQ